VQKDLLSKLPSATLRVFAVWSRTWPSDDRSTWPDTLLTDPRVVHFWDEGKLLGKCYGSQPEATARSQGIAWDAYFAYGADSVWGERPSQLAGWGSPIIRAKEQLAGDVEKLLAASGKTSLRSLTEPAEDQAAVLPRPALRLSFRGQQAEESRPFRGRHAASRERNPSLRSG
jgi:hypothetical protein